MCESQRQVLTDHEARVSLGELCVGKAIPFVTSVSSVCELIAPHFEASR